MRIPALASAALVLFSACAIGPGPEDVIPKTCVPPDPAAVATGLDATVKAKIPRIAEILDANFSVKAKVERIREEVPNLQSFEVVEYRMCRAYYGEIIDKDDYIKFISDILPALLNTDESYFEQRGREEGKAIGFISGRLKRYFEENGTYPETLADLGVQDQVEIVGESRISYQKTGADQYTLRFAGFDRRLNTSDDKVHTPEDAD